jgi:uncharacterized protein
MILFICAAVTEGPPAKVWLYMSYQLLLNFFNSHPHFALAFSGGTDSAFLLDAALKAGVDIKPYFVKTEFQPAFELEDALELYPKLTVIQGSTLSRPEIALNKPLRCYHCKTYILSLIKAQADKDGYSVLCDGTNASDETADRPGMKALEEFGVLSPLREAGLTKDAIRALSKKAGLKTWNKPSYSCLATRIPTGTAVSLEALNKIEAGESYLFSLGFTDFRLRLTEEGFRLELPAAQHEKAKNLMQALKERLGNLTLAERKV